MLRTWCVITLTNAGESPRPPCLDNDQTAANRRAGSQFVLVYVQRKTKTLSKEMILHNAPLKQWRCHR